MGAIRQGRSQSSGGARTCRRRLAEFIWGYIVFEKLPVKTRVEGTPLDKGPE